MSDSNKNLTKVNLEESLKIEGDLRVRVVNNQRVEVNLKAKEDRLVDLDLKARDNHRADPDRKAKEDHLADLDLKVRVDHQADLDLKAKVNENLKIRAGLRNKLTILRLLSAQMKKETLPALKPRRRRRLLSDQMKKEM